MAANPQPMGDPSEMSKYISPRRPMPADAPGLPDVGFQQQVKFPQSGDAGAGHLVDPADGIFGGAAPGLIYEGGTWEPENAPHPRSEPAAMGRLSSPSRPFPSGVKGSNGTSYATGMGDSHITGGRDQANR